MKLIYNNLIYSEFNTLNNESSHNELLETISPSALMSVKEMAKGIIYDDPIKTRWDMRSNDDDDERHLTCLTICPALQF